ncbi:MAG: hypothetical protein H6607_05280 [Flavobacteriales bacterium]|nr:hypothetical protein [Flavobacteriales bacterium]
MIKKISKFTLKLFVGIILLALVMYGVFHLWEYATGGKYVKYLKDNSETVFLEDSFSFEIAKSDINKCKLILVGEIHGTKEPTKFDVEFFKFLHKNYGIRSYVAELDFVQAEYLNQFLVNKDYNLLKKVLKRWVVAQGRNNEDYFNKYIQFQAFYESLNDNDKFQFFGIDKIQDWELTTQYLNDLLPEDQSILPIEYNTENLQEGLLKQINQLNGYYADNKIVLAKLANIKTNIEAVEQNINREDVMFSNFKTTYRENEFSRQKIYGYFGIYHVFQYRVNGEYPLAAKIRMSDLGLEDKMLSINFLMNDSYMVMDSKQLPEPMRDKGKYTKMKLSADNMLVMYIVGIKDLKRMTGKKQKSFIKMNSESSPYANSNRLNSSFQLLPVTDLFEMTDKGKPYIQYTIFVRNSDWAEPMKD